MLTDDNGSDDDNDDDNYDDDSTHRNKHVLEKIKKIKIIFTSSATFCLAIALLTFSYMTVLWIAIPQKIAKACNISKNTKQGIVKHSCTK